MSIRTVLCLTACLLTASGWRGDGSGVFTGTHVPESTVPTWSVALNARGNATPVVFGDMVCVTEEPWWVRCFDQDTGEPRWSVATTPASAASPERRLELESALREGEAIEAERLRLLSDYGRVRRAFRAASSDADRVRELRFELEAIQASMTEVDARLVELAPHRLGPVEGTLGWTTPTPVSDGERLFVSHSFGVVSAVDLAGEVVWSSDLGRPSVRFLGEEGGVPTGSPVLVDGVLVVVHETLVGLDTGTGEERWRSVPYPHYGSPAAVRAANGRVFIATPGGEIVDPTDGSLVAVGLTTLLYVGPYAQDEGVLFAGTSAASGRASVRGFKLDVAGQAVPWLNAELELESDVYGAPVWFDDRAWVVGRDGVAAAVDGHGDVTRWELPLPTGTEVWPGMVVVDGQLALSTDGGVAVLGSDLKVKRQFLPGPMLAGPLFSGDRLFLRTHDSLVAYGP